MLTLQSFFSTITSFESTFNNLSQNKHDVENYRFQQNCLCFKY